MILGTPAYLSPEQGTDPLSADARSDIYSLGCTLYHLLTGRVPFRGASAHACAEQHRTATATPVEESRPGLPRGLGDVVRKMMARQPSDRFASASEVATALDAFCGGATEFYEGAPEDRRPRGDSVGGSAASTLPSITLRPSMWSSVPLLILGAVGILALVTLGLAAGGIWPFDFNRPDRKDGAQPIPIRPNVTTNSPYLIVWRGGDPAAFTATHEVEGSLKIVVDGKIVNDEAVIDSVEIVANKKKLNKDDKEAQTHQPMIQYLLQRAEEKSKQTLPPATGFVPKHWHVAPDGEDVHAVAMPMKPHIERQNEWNILISNSPHKFGVFKTLAALMPAKDTETPELLFRNSRMRATQALRGRLEFEKYYKFGPFPAYEAHVGIAYADGQRGTEFIRLYLVGNHLIFLHAQAAGSVPHEEVNAFFQSFALLPRTRLHGGVRWQGRTVQYRITAHADAVVKTEVEEAQLNLRVTSAGKERTIVVRPNGAEHAGEKAAKESWTTLDVGLDDGKADFVFDRKDAKPITSAAIKAIPSVTLRPDRTFAARYVDETNSVDIKGKLNKGSATPDTITIGPPQKSVAFKTLDAAPVEQRDLLQHLLTHVESLGKDYRKPAE